MAPILSDTTPHDPYLQWILIAMAIATIFYAVIRPAMKKKDPLAKTPAMGSLAQQRSVERQMQNLLVELAEMARQISAQLDTRSQKLDMLIQDADHRISELKKMKGQAPSSASKPWPPLSDTVPRNIPIPEPADEQHQPIYTLADQGKRADEIARELNRPRGEVELILALRPPAERI